MKVCLQKAFIHNKDRLIDADFSEKDIASANATLAYVMMHCFSGVLQGTFTKWYTALIVGILAKGLADAIIRMALTHRLFEGAVPKLGHFSAPKWDGSINKLFKNGPRVGRKIFMHQSLSEL